VLSNFNFLNILLEFRGLGSPLKEITLDNVYRSSKKVAVVSTILFKNFKIKNKNLRSSFVENSLNKLHGDSPKVYHSIRNH